MPAHALCRTLALIAGLLLPAAANSAPVGFDNTFGSGGKVYANLLFGPSDDIAQAVVMQPDGAMVVAGTCFEDFCVARFLPNGDLDPSFGGGGKLVTPIGIGADVARAVTLDGTRIVVAGSCTQGGETNFCVARYLANGTLDTSFNGTGKVITAVGLLADQAYAVAMDGTAIVVAGECEVEGVNDSCMVRYLANGALDASFGSGGKVILSLVASSDGIRGLAITGGKAIVASRCFFNNGNFCVARFNANGTLDSGFGTGGKVMTLLTPFNGVQRIDDPNALALLTDGRIAIAGSCTDEVFVPHMCLLVLNSDGTRSTVINGSGQVILTVPTTTAAAATGVATVSNNAMYLSGPCTVSAVQRFCIAAITGLGTLSAVFNSGQVLVDALNVSVDAVPSAIAAVFDPGSGNTAISVVGSCGGTFVHDVCAARYRETGNRITSFGIFGVKVQELNLGRISESALALARQADGKIVVAGRCSANTCIARFHPDGSLDTSFATGGVFPGAPSSGGQSRIALDGTDIVYATQVSGGLQVTRLLANGSPEPSWGGGTGAISPALPADWGSTGVAGVAAVGGGSVVIGFTCVVPPVYIGDFCVLKLMASGALDPSFNAAGTTPGLRFESIAFQDQATAMAMDGTSIVVAGHCRPGFYVACILRLTSAGVPDTTFNGTGKVTFPMGSADTLIHAMSLSTLTGSITVAGACTPGSKEDFCLGRVTASGSLDTSFNGTGTTSLSLGLFASRAQALIADGTGVVAAGTCANDGLGVFPDLCLARFNANGILDIDFNGTGSIRTQVGSAVDPLAVTDMIRDGSRFLASVGCVAPGSGNDFCLAAYVQLPASLPGAPFITGVASGDAQATVSLVPPVNNGGSAISSYTATCGTRSASGASSPLTVTGLLNGVSVPCSATATNSAGTGPSSTPPINVTPRRVAAVVLTASVNPSSATGTVTFSASVVGQGPTGMVEFRLPGNLPVPGCVGGFSVVSGVASCPTNTFSAPGTYSITATYLGDTANTVATSNTLSHTVIATFEQLTIVKLGTGSATVTSTPAGITCGATCTAQYATNTAVTLTATPATGTVVASWFNCDFPSGNQCITLMLGNRTVELTLAPQQYTLTVAKAGPGSGSVTSSPAAIDCGATCAANIGAGAVATLTATPAAGSLFGGWSGACIGTGACQVTMDAAKNVTATFTVAEVPGAPTIGSATAGNGFISVAFTPPASIGSSAILDYTATCGTASATGTASPLVVSGLINGTAYTCNVVARNAAGTGPASALSGSATPVTPPVVPQPPPANPPRLGNLSTRMQVRTGNDVMIGGFVIGGSTNKTVVVRARGPSLVPFGIANALANPTLQLVRSSDQATIAANDDFGTAANLAALQASSFAPDNALESAVLVALPPGAYTAIVSGVNGGTGVGIIEVFEVDQPGTPLANISTRGQVLTGNDVMIGGFVINGDAPQTVVIRARGPSLVPFGITNALANPALQLVRSSDQVTLASNDNWGSATNAADVTTSGFAPDNALESAILITLPPGAYTAIVTGAGGGTGVGIVEVFAQ